ncbi:MAG: hypothetical protein AAF267_14465 [Deinococcota bacterium]
MRQKPPQDARADASTQPYTSPYQAFLIKLYTPKLASVQADDAQDATPQPPTVILQHAHDARCLEFASLAEAFNYLHTLTKEPSSAS